MYKKTINEDVGEICSGSLVYCKLCDIKKPIILSN
jgi:predicted metal-binding transcription factor (methanogenesis marker protein 9)